MHVFSHMYYLAFVLNRVRLLASGDHTCHTHRWWAGVDPMETPVLLSLGSGTPLSGMGFLLPSTALLPLGRGLWSPEAPCDIEACQSQCPRTLFLHNVFCV